MKRSVTSRRSAGSRASTRSASARGTPPCIASAIEPAMQPSVSASPPSETALRIASSTLVEPIAIVAATGTVPGPVPRAQLLERSRAVVAEARFEELAQLGGRTALARDEDRRGHRLRTLHALRVVVRDHRAPFRTPPHVLQRVVRPADRRDAHRGAVSVAPVRTGAVVPEPLGEVTAISRGRIATAPAPECLREVAALEHDLGDGHGEHAVVRRAREALEQLEVLGARALELVDRADDVARDRSRTGENPPPQ